MPNSIDRGPSSDATQELPQNLLNPNVHYRSHKILPHVSIQKQMNPVHALTHSSKAHFNIIKLL